MDGARGLAMTWNWRDRGRAAGLHLAISLAIAALAGLLVFVVWYPYPYRSLSGGSELFAILVGVDVIIGPLITLAVFDRVKKPLAELRRDLAVIAALQVAALGYGLWTVALARPVHLVFEFDRFRVIHAAEVPVDLLDQAPRGIDPLPLWGPTLVAVRPFGSEQQRMQATIAALNGLSLSSRPDLWEGYPPAVHRVQAAGRPLAELKARFPERAAEIDAELARAGLPAGRAVWLPLASRKTFWTVFIDASTAQPAAFIPLDSF
jgi:hypothetical protein